jgi:hypothetical protein
LAAPTAMRPCPMWMGWTDWCCLLQPFMLCNYHYKIRTHVVWAALPYHRRFSSSDPILHMTLPLISWTTEHVAIVVLKLFVILNKDKKTRKSAGYLSLR